MVTKEDCSMESAARTLVAWVALVLFVPWLLAACSREADTSTEPLCTSNEIEIAAWGFCGFGANEA
jgi:hypothetical protein